MTVVGLHHITLVARDMQRTIDFYTQILGLNVVKQTVNFDDPSSYHIYFGDSTGRPGTVVTYFEWPEAPKGAHGIGGTHHYAMSVQDRSVLLKWKRRLTDLGIEVRGPFDRTYFESIYFDDPDGVIIELATAGPGFGVDEPLDALGQIEQRPPLDVTAQGRDNETIAAETWPEPVEGIEPDMTLSSGMHHITAIGADIHRTHAFFGELLGLRLVKQTINFDDPNSKHWYWSTAADGQPGTLITYFERDPKKTRIARLGVGHTHHFALAVSDEDSLLAWRARLVDAGLTVSPVRDRTYFKSIYTKDPDGQIVELATLGPGFMVDEPAESLGTSLLLPPHVDPAAVATPALRVR
ncbi:MAG: VOC family protein [Chloroflexi bacterium]|nr:VOC family protein [Chloroflexota bacterium]